MKMTFQLCLSVVRILAIGAVAGPLASHAQPSSSPLVGGGAAANFPDGNAWPQPIYQKAAPGGNLRGLVPGGLSAAAVGFGAGARVQSVLPPGFMLGRPETIGARVILLARRACRGRRSPARANGDQPRQVLRHLSGRVPASRWPASPMPWRSLAALATRSTPAAATCRNPSMRRARRSSRPPRPRSRGRTRPSARTSRGSSPRA